MKLATKTTTAARRMGSHNDIRGTIMTSSRAGRGAASVPLETPQLVEVDVAAGEDDRDAAARRKLDEPVQEGGDRRGRGALDDELAALHHPDHRIEDLPVWQGDEIVHEALDH